MDSSSPFAVVPSSSPEPAPALPGATGERSAPAAGPFIVQGLDDLQASVQARPPWLWHGYLAPGNVTLLTSQWKSGKTTLVSVLLARLGAGGELAGLALRPGKAVVVSEEAAGHWLDRSQRLDFGGHVGWLLRPFRGKPRPEEWLALVEQLAALGRERALDLVVIDPLASFLPGGGENNAAAMLDWLLPLQHLTTLGLAVLVLHHPTKGEPRAGQAARGSGALAGYVDILIEMQWHQRATEDDRRRRLVAYSRHAATPRRLVIELNAAGTDYLAHGDFQDDDFTQSWEALHSVLEAAQYKLTRRELLKQWPEDYRKPDEVTLWRWLERAVRDGRVLQAGTGRKNAPFVYWLPGQEEKWRNDPFRLPDLPPLGELQDVSFILDGLRSRRKSPAADGKGPSGAPQK